MKGCVTTVDNGGQSKQSQPSDITCLKSGAACHSILARVEKMWQEDVSNLEQIPNHIEIDEEQSELNEIVIFSDSDD